MTLGVDVLTSLMTDDNALNAKIDEALKLIIAPPTEEASFDDSNSIISQSDTEEPFSEVCAKEKSSWATLTDSEQNAAELLGWSMASWNAGQPPQVSQAWAHLETRQQFAAQVLGYDRFSWDEELGDDNNSNDGTESTDSSGDERHEPRRRTADSDEEGSDCSASTFDSRTTGSEFSAATFESRSDGFEQPSGTSRVLQGPVAASVDSRQLGNSDDDNASDDESTFSDLGTQCSYTAFSAAGDGESVVSMPANAFPSNPTRREMDPLDNVGCEQPERPIASLAHPIYEDAPPEIPENYSEMRHDILGDDANLPASQQPLYEPADPSADYDSHENNAWPQTDTVDATVYDGGGGGGGAGGAGDGGGGGANGSSAFDADYHQTDSSDETNYDQAEPSADYWPQTDAVSATQHLHPDYNSQGFRAQTSDSTGGGGGGGGGVPLGADPYQGLLGAGPSSYPAADFSTMEQQYFEAAKVLRDALAATEAKLAATEAQLQRALAELGQGSWDKQESHAADLEQKLQSSEAKLHLAEQSVATLTSSLKRLRHRSAQIETSNTALKARAAQLTKGGSSALISKLELSNIALKARVAQLTKREERVGFHADQSVEQLQAKLHLAEQQLQLRSQPPVLDEQEGEGGDRDITCRDCVEPFVFTVQAQAHHASKEWIDPVRCQECKKATRERVAAHEELSNAASKAAVAAHEEFSNAASKAELQNTLLQSSEAKRLAAEQELQQMQQQLLLAQTFRASELPGPPSPASQSPQRPVESESELENGMMVQLTSDAPDGFDGEPIMVGDTGVLQAHDWGSCLVKWTSLQFAPGDTYECRVHYSCLSIISGIKPVTDQNQGKVSPTIVASVPIYVVRATAEQAKQNINAEEAWPSGQRTVVAEAVARLGAQSSALGRRKTELDKVVTAIFALVQRCGGKLLASQIGSVYATVPGAKDQITRAGGAKAIKTWSGGRLDFINKQGSSVIFIPVVRDAHTGAYAADQEALAEQLRQQNTFHAHVRALKIPQGGWPFNVLCNTYQRLFNRSDGWWLDAGFGSAMEVFNSVPELLARSGSNYIKTAATDKAHTQFIPATGPLAAQAVNTFRASIQVLEIPQGGWPFDKLRSSYEQLFNRSDGWWLDAGFGSAMQAFNSVVPDLLVRTGFAGTNYIKTATIVKTAVAVARPAGPADPTFPPTKQQAELARSMVKFLQVALVKRGVSNPGSIFTVAQFIGRFFTEVPQHQAQKPKTGKGQGRAFLETRADLFVLGELEHGQWSIDLTASGWALAAQTRAHTGADAEPVPVAASVPSRGSAQFEQGRKLLEKTKAEKSKKKLPGPRISDDEAEALFIRALQAACDSHELPFDISKVSVAMATASAKFLGRTFAIGETRFKRFMQLAEFCQGKGHLRLDRIRGRGGSAAISATIVVVAEVFGWDE